MEDGKSDGAEGDLCKSGVEGRKRGGKGEKAGKGMGEKKNMLHRRCIGVA
jgi:hypothetical protein